MNDQHLLTSKWLAAAIAVLAVVLTQTVAFAQPAPGIELRGTIASSINTKTAYVGEDVLVVASADGSIQGATLRGIVTHVVHAGQGTPGRIRLHFNHLTLRNGTSYPIDGVVTSVNAQTKSNAAKEVGGALGGMLLGNAIFKTLFAASGGGIIGAIGGYLIAKNNREDMTIPAGSAVAVRLVSPRRQAQSAG